MGYICGKRVNVIIQPGEYCPCSNFEDLEDIIKIKEQWVEKALKEGKKPREKDVNDIETYKIWKDEKDLPF